MSHIDSFKHEMVGLFGGLPVYHPLEVIDGDFECSPSQLELAKPLMDALDDAYRHFHHQRYNNVLLIPPNMPVYANGGNAFESRRRRPA